MAIVRCPSCTKRTSDQQKQCPHCGSTLNLDDADVGERRRYLKDRLYRFRMGGHVSVTVMVLAIIIWWIPTNGQLSDIPVWLKAALAAGVLGQGYCRYHILRIKRLLKALADNDKEA